MKLHIFLFIVFQVLQDSLEQNCNITSKEVDQYLNNIENLETQAFNWTFPENSLSYLGNSSQEEYFYDGDYDFIIVGSGSSGSVLANRLSEKKYWKILLLEAGTWENKVTDIPGLTDNLRTSDYNWGYKGLPQGSNLAGYVDNAFLYPRGKAIGGTSVINSMVYSRGNPGDFDKWGLENPGWKYKDVLPYFQKSENACFPHASPLFHGRNGTLHVEHSKAFNKVGEAFLQAQIQLNRTVSQDYNGANQMSFSILQLTEINGRRNSGGKAFINPAKNRTNFRILPNTLVTRLRIHKKTKIVYGVEYIKNGSKYYANAKKEVLLSAGAVNSPQLLMLSGIGPKKHLNKLGIQIIKNLPVGENLWDHLIYNSQSFSINYTYTTENLTTQVKEYFKGEGPLTTADDIQCIGYVNLMNTSSQVPDVEYVLHSAKSVTASNVVYKNLFRITEDSYKYVLTPTFNTNFITLNSFLLHPKSRGIIKLQSNSPFDFPLINPKYFSHPQDAGVLVAALKDHFKIFNTPAMQKLNATLIKTCHPLCNCSDYGSDNFLLCMVKTMANTGSHLAGTTKMGPVYDKTAVVGANLKVHGVNNLRVVDCSVIPVTTSGHLNAVAYMIGEKAADLIKNEY